MFGLSGLIARNGSWLSMALYIRIKEIYSPLDSATNINLWLQYFEIITANDSYQCSGIIYK